MKVRGGKRETKDSLSKKVKNNKNEAVFKTKDERTSLINWRLDKNNLSENDLDRIMAYS